MMIFRQQGGCGHSVLAAAVSRYQSMIVGWEKQLCGTPCLSPTLYTLSLHPLPLHSTTPCFPGIAIPHKTLAIIWQHSDRHPVVDNHDGIFCAKVSTTTKCYEKKVNSATFSFSNKIHTEEQIHSNLDITNKSIRPFLFTLSNN